MCSFLGRWNLRGPVCQEVIDILDEHPARTPARFGILGSIESHSTRVGSPDTARAAEARTPSDVPVGSPTPRLVLCEDRQCSGDGWVMRPVRPGCGSPPAMQESRRGCDDTKRTTE